MTALALHYPTIPGDDELRIAFYDRLSADPPDLYASLGAIVSHHNRFHPLRVGEDGKPDLIITTHTRPPDLGVPILNAGSHKRHLSTIYESPVWTFRRSWSAHGVAAYTIRALCNQPDQVFGTYRPIRLLVVGGGRIGSLVARYARRAGWSVDVVGRADIDSLSPRRLAAYTAVSFHAGSNARPVWDDRLLALNGAAVVNTGAPAFDDAALHRAVALGAVRYAVLNVPCGVEHERIRVDPRHTAWEATDRAAIHRPAMIRAFIRAYQAEDLVALDHLATLDAPAP